MSPHFVLATRMLCPSPRRDTHLTAARSPAEPGSVPVGAGQWAGAGAESCGDSALGCRVHRAHPFLIPPLLRSSPVPSGRITGLRGGSSLCLSARRRSSFPGLARSPLQGHELGMASPVLQGRLGEAIAQERPGASTEALACSKSRSREGSRDPARAPAERPGAPALAPPWPAARHSWVEAGQGREHPRKAQPRGGREGKCTLQAKFVSVPAGEISLSCESQRRAHLALLDKERPLWNGERWAVLGKSCA